TCTKIPSISLSLFNSVIFSNSISSVISLSYLKSDELMPTSLQFFTLEATYVSLAGSLPTRMAARCGTFFPFDVNAETLFFEITQRARLCRETRSPQRIKLHREPQRTTEFHREASLIKSYTQINAPTF